MDRKYRKQGQGLCSPCVRPHVGWGGGGGGGILSGFLIMENSCDSHPKVIALVDYCIGIL